MLSRGMEPGQRAFTAWWAARSGAYPETLRAQWANAQLHERAAWVAVERALVDEQWDADLRAAVTALANNELKPGYIVSTIRKWSMS